MIDLKNAESTARELSDEELEAASGGLQFVSLHPPTKILAELLGQKAGEKLTGSSGSKE